MPQIDDIYPADGDGLFEAPPSRRDRLAARVADASSSPSPDVARRSAAVGTALTLNDADVIAHIDALPVRDADRLRNAIDRRVCERMVAERTERERADDAALDARGYLALVARHYERLTDYTIEDARMIVDGHTARITRLRAAGKSAREAAAALV